MDGVSRSPRCRSRVNSLQIERDQLEQELIIANDNVERANSQLVQANQDLDAARRNAMDLQSRLSAAQLSMTQNPASRQSNLPADWEGSSSSPGIAWTDIGDTILFDSGKATLKSSGKDKRQVASQIRSSFPNRQIWVVGHTDSDPIKKSGWKDNLELSLAALRRRHARVAGPRPRSAARGRRRPGRTQSQSRQQRQG